NGLFKKVYQEVDAEALNMFDNNSIVTNLDLFEKNLIKILKNLSKYLEMVRLKRIFQSSFELLKMGKKGYLSIR
ncbi:MAG TPA: hypothetical protein PLI56_06195, partial [Exilispira sp.]|nr:hypothetical protein [Exilispira sp.]